MSLFQKSVINKYLKNLDTEKVNKAYENFRQFYGDKLRLHNIMQLKEENYQEGFLREIFVETLGYTINPDNDFNLTTEFKNLNDARKADGAILRGGKAIGVIELKSTKTKHLESIKEQAFSYKNNQPGCRYVITSNFQSLRFYIDDATEYEEFNLFKLTEKDFKLLYLLLSKDSIFSDLPQRLKEETKFHENDISAQLYTDYKRFKDKIFENLVKNNPQYDKLLLFKKSQKLLDRFLFVFFAEDSGLIPPNTISKIIEQWKQLQELDEYMPLYSRFQKLFSHLDKGHTYKKWGEIPAYNGGLFRDDELLDGKELIIDDDVLEKDSLTLSAYDFNTDVDVNILGHIFEHSLNEIENISAQLQGEEIDKKKTKRKKDGIFYTPKYITKYIVENTVGTLCKEKKEELQINNLLIDDTFRKADGKLTAKAKKLFEKLEEYRNWLLSLKVLDPACGSGAFLNQTLTFFIEEHNWIADRKQEITGDASRMYLDTDKAILENNIYGVDINEESVEIAKLSLWLRTAQKGRPLSDLSGNIKCGNSLIDDPEVAGKKAFDWNIEFKEIMEKGGFDVVIGNPPWGAKLNKNELDILCNLYPTISKTKDSYMFFIAKQLNIVKSEGFFSFIVPNTWLLINSAKEFRKMILKENIIEIADYGDEVFSDATVESMILTIKKCKKINASVKTKRFKNQSLFYEATTKKNNWLKDEYYRINIERTDEIDTFIEKLNSKSVFFNDVAEIIWGIKPYQVGHGIPKQTKEMQSNRIYHSDKQIDNSWKPLLVGSNINRYSLTSSEIQYVKYGNNLMYPSNEEKMIAPKILLRQTSDILRACVDESSFYCQNSLFIITSSVLNLKYLNLLLNSRLINFVYYIFNPQSGKTFAEIKPSVVKTLPIRNISKNEQKIYIEKADQMLFLNKELQEKSQRFIKRIKSNLEIEKISGKLQNFYNFDFKTFLTELKKQKIKLSLKEQDEWEEYFDTYKQEINQVQTQISQTDKEIDKMVYELYELTEEEIGIVENSVK